MVNGLVTRGVPVVQDFDGFPKVLNPKLSSSEHILVLLYQQGESGATADELSAWSKPIMRANLNRTLGGLTHNRALVHFDDEKYFITASGMKEVEKRGLLEMPT